jgi:hypothetical protein
MVGAYSVLGKDEKYIQNFSWKTAGKNPHERPRCSWENIKIDSKENMVQGCWLHPSSSGQSAVISFYEHSDESLYLKTGGQFVHCLNEYYVLERKSVPWS